MNDELGILDFLSAAIIGTVTCLENRVALKGEAPREKLTLLVGTGRHNWYSVPICQERPVVPVGSFAPLLGAFYQV